MMDIYSAVQKALDDNLYEQENIPSFHLRKVETSESSECYVVYSLVSTVDYHGDGKRLLTQYNIDINFYYNKDSVATSKVFRIIEVIKSSLIKNEFYLKNGEQDIFDSQGIYRGLNLEFFFVG